MSVNNKHLATFLLGAAAAFGAYKYANMTDEEKEKLAASLKEKANKLKDQAVAAEDKAMDYFNELKTKGSDAMQEYMPKMEEFFNNLFGGNKDESASTDTVNTATASTSGTQTAADDTGSFNTTNTASPTNFSTQ